MKRLTAALPNLVLLSALAYVPDAGAAQQYGPLKIETSLRAQVVNEDNVSLGTAMTNGQDSEVLEAKIRATLRIHETLTAFSEIRGVKNYGEGGSSDPDTGDSFGVKDFIELRQMWIEGRNLFGQVPLSLRVGRQRFVEPTSLWWNRDLDAARLAFNTTLLNGFLAVGQNMRSYKSSDDDFNNDREMIARVLGEASFQWRYDHFIEARAAYQKDRSGQAAIGDDVPEDDLDNDDADLLWGGIRARGAFNGFDAGRKAGYRVDLMAVRGNEDSETTVAAPGPFRTVTGYTDQDVRGWAFDSSIVLPMPVVAEPVVVLGYAFGSGDDDAADGTDNGFRQTGLDSNNSRIGLASASIHNYGSVLRPDLSNMHILTAGVGFPVFGFSDFSGLYHYYRLDEDATALSSSGLDAALNGTDRDVGHGFDLMLNSNLTRELGWDAAKTGQVSLRGTFGVFRSGDAYGPAGDDKLSSRAYLSLGVTF